MLTEIEIRFTPDGKAKAQWWSPEIAEMLCSICGPKGWQKYGPISPEEMFLSQKEGEEKFGRCFMCSTRNPYCG